MINPLAQFNGISYKDAIEKCEPVKKIVSIDKKKK